MKDDNDGYTGKLFEHDVLREGAGIFHVVAKPPYKTYKKAMAEVVEKTNQSNWDPSDPNTRVCNDLHATVAINLNLDDWNELKLYPAVGSAFDIYHGVDMFFELDGKIVTIDLTVNTDKDFYKANVIVTPEMIEDIESLAKEITDILI